MSVEKLPFYVRRASHRDLSALAEISKSAFGESSNGGRFRKRQSVHAADGSLFWIALSKAGEPAGYVFATMSAATRKIFVWELAVHQRLRKAGAAQSLLATIEQEALSLGGTMIELHCSPDNTAGKRLYRKCGYWPTEIIDDYISDGGSISRLAYTKGLKPADSSNVIEFPGRRDSETSPFSPGVI